MKIRKGFVSNSSSSSFVCDVCGNEQSGMDLSLQDAEMYNCENGHIFCQEHILDFDKKEIAIKMLNDKIAYYKEKGYDCNTETEMLSDIENNPDAVDFEEILNNMEFEYQCPAICCPICQFDEFKSSETLEYMLIRSNVSKDELKIELKSKFTNYKDFKKLIGK